MRSLLRDNTPSEFGSVLIEEDSTAGTDASEAEAVAEVESLLGSFGCAAPVNAKLPSPSQLSFTLCALISLSAQQEQAALELSAASRLRALREQLLINPPRGKELLEQAAVGTPRPPKKAAGSCQSR